MPDIVLEGDHPRIISAKSSQKPLGQLQPNFGRIVFGWPLPKLGPVIPTSNHDGHQAKNRKKGDEILKK
jgi:hypothetical protein